MHNNIKLNNTQ